MVSVRGISIKGGRTSCFGCSYRGLVNTIGKIVSSGQFCVKGYLEFRTSDGVVPLPFS